MSRRKWIVLGASLLVLTVGAEFAVRLWSSAKGCVQVINQGDHEMGNLVVSYGGTTISVGRVGAGESANVWFSPRSKGPLTLEFNQKGNAAKGFQLADFDPGENARTGSKLVLVVDNKQIQRYMDDDLSRKPLSNMVESVKEWFLGDVDPTR